MSKAPMSPARSRVLSAWMKTIGDTVDPYSEENLRTLEIWLGIFDAMTPEECCKPWIAREPSRAERVAKGAGTNLGTVEQCVKAWMKELGRVNRRWSFSELCRTTHSNLLVGTCPWCGSTILPELLVWD